MVRLRVVNVSEPPTTQAFSGPTTCISRIAGDTEMRVKAQLDGFPTSVRPWTRPLYPLPKPLPDGAAAGGVLYYRDSGTGKGRLPRRPAETIATAGSESRYAHLGPDPPPSPLSPPRAEASRTIPQLSPVGAPPGRQATTDARAPRLAS